MTQVGTPSGVFSSPLSPEELFSTFATSLTGSGEYLPKPIVRCSNMPEGAGWDPVRPQNLLDETLKRAFIYSKIEKC